MPRMRGVESMSCGNSSSRWNAHAVVFIPACWTVARCNAGHVYVSGVGGRFGPSAHFVAVKHETQVNSRPGSCFLHDDPWKHC